MGVFQRGKGEVPAVFEAQLLAGVGAVGPGVKRAIGGHGNGQAQLVQGRDEVVTPRFEFGAAAFVFGQALGLKAGQCSLLRHGAGTNEQVLCQALQHGRELLGHHQPAQAPASHVEVFAEAVDADDIVAQGQGALTELVVMAQAEIDLVDQGDAAFCANNFQDAGQFSRVNGRPRGVGR